MVRISLPIALARYVVEKGSITVDGISLTVNGVRGAEFDLTIVPHTVQETNIGSWLPGSTVNLEVDVIARYLERLLLGEKAAQTGQGSGLTAAFLAENGFMK